MENFQSFKPPLDPQIAFSLGRKHVLLPATRVLSACFMYCANMGCRCLHTFRFGFGFRKVFACRDMGRVFRVCSRKDQLWLQGNRPDACKSIRSFCCCRTSAHGPPPPPPPAHSDRCSEQTCGFAPNFPYHTYS